MTEHPLDMPAAPALLPAWRATGQERQVFLSESGRRARLLRTCGAFGCAFGVAAASALFTAPLGFSHMPVRAPGLAVQARPMVTHAVGRPLTGGVEALVAAGRPLPRAHRVHPS